MIRKRKCEKNEFLRPILKRKAGGLWDDQKVVRVT